MTEVEIREAGQADLDAVMEVERRAFGQDDEALLVRDLMGDASARPILSLLAESGGTAVGHVLFTTATLAGPQDAPDAAILAPLAVLPEAQGQGVGRRLVEAGLERLAQDGVALVFVLGDPAYYSRFGFAPAAPLGLAPPYELPAAYAEAWMVKALVGGVLGSVRATVHCADMLAKPEYWRA